MFRNQLKFLVVLFSLAGSVLFPASASATSNYRDLNYQVYWEYSGSGWGVYLNPLPKELLFHFQASNSLSPGMPETQIQAYPLEPTALASITGVCSPSTAQFAGAYVASIFLAAYQRAPLVVHGDWNQDGLEDMLVLGPPDSCGSTYNTYSLFEILNNGQSTPPTLLYIPVPINSQFGQLLDGWKNNTMAPVAVDLNKNGFSETLEFVNNTKNASGNYDFWTVTPGSGGSFQVTGVDSSTSDIATGNSGTSLNSVFLDSPDPSDILPRVIGATGGSYSVGLDGSANYSIPIAVPPAAGGIQPSVSLGYSSAAGSGNMGFGWAMSGFSKISRCGKSMKVDGVVQGITYTSDDQFCLDGSRLVPVPPHSGSSGVEYALENELLMRVIPNGTSAGGMPQSFTVLSADGTQMVYGGTTDSQILANGANAGLITEWALSKVTDKFSNYREYSYDQNSTNGTYVLRSISYGANNNAGTCHTNNIQFEYTDNPTGYTGYLGGSSLGSEKLLTQVSTNALSTTHGSSGCVTTSSKELRFYAMRYKLEPTSDNVYLLDSVSECSGGGYCLSPTSFTWESGGTAAFQPVATTTGLKNGDIKAVETYIDLNGDGIPDRVVWNTAGGSNQSINGLYVYLGNGSGGFGAEQLWGSEANNFEASYVAGDLSNVTNQDTFCGTLVSYGYTCSLFFADVNGDGLPDYVFTPRHVAGAASYTPSGLVYVALNTGSSFQAPSLWMTVTRGSSGNSQTGIFHGDITVQDVNGDGLADIVFPGSCNNDCGTENNWDVEVALSTGTSLQSPAVWLAAPTTTNNGVGGNYPSSGNSSRIQLIDLTGDGLPDRVWLQPQSTSNDVLMVSVNQNGTGFSAGSYWLYQTAPSGADSTKQVNTTLTATDPAWEGFADFNGDGLADRYWMQHDDSLGDMFMVALSDGTQFKTPYVWYYDTVVDAKPVAGTGYGIVDMNDDGQVDLVWLANDPANKVMVASQVNGEFGAAKPWLVMNSSSNGSGTSEDAPTTTNRQYFLDMNGDGMTDIVWAPGGSVTSVDIGLSQASVRADLQTVTNGFGHQTTFTYNTLDSTSTAGLGSVYTGCGMNYPDYSLKPCMVDSARVVQHVDVSNGTGGTAGTTYSYSGLHFDLSTKQSLGFNTIIVKNDQTGIQDETTYSQDVADNTQGLILETLTRDTVGQNVLSDTVNHWHTVTLDQTNTSVTQVVCNITNLSTCTKYIRYIRTLTDTTVTKYDLNGSFLYKEVNTYQYDAYGHINQQETDEYGSGSSSLKTTYINTNYVNDTNDWRLGLSSAVSTETILAGGDTSYRTSTWDYDSNCNVVSENVWSGAMTNGSDPISCGTSPASGTLKLLATSHVYDQWGHVTSSTVSAGTNGAVSRTSSTSGYDPTGRFVTSSTNVLSQSATTAYYDNSTVSSGHYPGLPQTVTDANGVVMYYTYDTFGRPQSTTTAYGSSSAVTTTSNFVSCSSVASDCGTIHAAYAITSTTTGGTTKTVFYDLLGRVVRTSGQVQGGSTVNVDKVYDSYGNNTKTSEPYIAGNAITWNYAAYDRLGRTTAAAQPSPNLQGYRLDTVSYSGYQITTTANATSLPSGFPSITLASLSDPTVATNQVTVTQKNPLGQVTSVTDTNGKSLSYSYDSLGHLLTTTDAAGNTTTLYYDPMGNKTKMVDPDKGTWYYLYNPFGQVVAQKNARNEVTCMAYDVLGRVTTRVDYFGGSTGTFSSTATTLTTLGSDALNNCANAGSSAKVALWSYDGTNGIGKLYQAKLDAGYPVNEYIETHSYDSLSRPATTTRVIQGTTYQEDVGYDSLNRPATITYPGPTGDRFAVHNTYDSLGFLATVDDASNSSLHYWQANNMDARGHVTSETFGNGVTTLLGYDSGSGALTSIYSSKSGLPVIQDIGVSFDSLGNLLARHDNTVGVSETFTYDAINRVVSSTGDFSGGISGNSDTRTQSVSYDSNGLGNITFRSDVGTYAYGSACGSVTIGGSTGTAAGPHAVCAITSAGNKNTLYSYDANGNQLSGDGRTMTYNAFDLPTQISRSGTTSTIAYGPDHQRYVRTDNSGGNNTTTVTVSGLYEKVTMPNGDVLEKHYIGGFAVKIIKNRSTDNTRTVSYLFQDHIGSLTAVTDDSGNLVELHNHDPWGNRRNLNVTTLTTLLGNTLWGNLSGTQLLSGTTTSGYTGQEMYDAVGIIHMNGRTYDPEIGVFMQADTIVQDAGDLQAFNRYAYVRNNPLVLTDPSGHSWAVKTWHKFTHSSMFNTAVTVACIMFPQLAFMAAVDYSAFRETGRLMTRVPQLEMVADAAIIAFSFGSLTWLVPIVNAGLSASVTYRSTGNFGSTMESAAVAYAASVAAMEAGGQNVFAAGTPTLASEMGYASSGTATFIAGMSVGGAISKAQGGRFFDSKSFMESMAISILVPSLIKGSEWIISTLSTDSANQSDLAGDGNSDNASNSLSYKDLGGSCKPSGETSWRIQWQLSQPSPSGGWIIQEMTISIDGQDPIHYWEAWQVRAGSTVTTYALGPVPPSSYDDEYLSVVNSPHIQWTGSARFYEGLDLPISFMVRLDPFTGAPLTPAGQLPMTYQNPNLPTNGTAPINRSYSNW